VLDGTAELAMASSLIPSDIEGQRQLQGIELKTTLVGYATLLAVVHPDNPVNDLSLKQVKDIFTGRIDNWKKVGGRDAPITVYVGPPTGGINDTWKSLILDEEDSYTPSGKVLNNHERPIAVAAQPNAITFLTRDQTDLSKVKILAIDHTEANANDVRQGTYVLRAPLLLVNRADAGADIKNLIDYFIVQARTSKLELIALGGSGHE
jgi:phosphate transport system substrate-binding protein